MVWVILFVVGLVIGSFLNVLALRYQGDKAILGRHVLGGRSACMSCRVTLRWYELVPLFSFLAQGAKCRHCQHSLNWQYPIIEFLAGGLTVVIPWQLQTFYANWYNANPHLIGWFYVVVATWLLVAYTSLVIGAIDVRLKIIPDQSSVLLAICGILLTVFRLLTVGQVPTPYFTGVYAPSLGGGVTPIMSVLIALAFSALLFGSIVYFSRGRGMGMGDVKLGLAMSLILGWPDILLAVMSAFIIGSVIGLLLIANKKATLKAAVPFGPFLLLGIFIVMFYGESLLRWYFSLL